MKRQWTKEEAWNWHNNRDWIRGCNFIGSDCCSRVDMWQSYKSKEHLATADRELALCKETGFNAIRIILDFEVWYQEPESYMEILEAYLSLAHKNGQGVMICLTCEALLPRGEFSEFKLKPLGEQIYALGHHQGRFPLSEEEKAKKPYHYMEHPELKAPFLTMMKDVVTKYKDDERVICWNVYNEPGINIGENSIPLLRELFDLVRSCDPMQPLTADVWRSLPLKEDGIMLCEEEKVAIELSDVVSFHTYKPYHKVVPQIEGLEAFGRPLLCTEWLNRINHSYIKDLYPLFYLKKISCFMWGFVVGKTQTNEAWDALWNDYYKPGSHVDYDFTKWLHDIYRPNFRPYDPSEIELLKLYGKYADWRDKKRN